MARAEVSAVLLDTHVLVWLVQGDEQLSAAARKRIESAAPIWISTISVWEVGVLVAKGRLHLAQDVQEWIDEVLALPGLTLASLGAEVAIASTRLPGEFHGDPADRIIVATARHLGATLITADDKILAWGARGHVQVMPAR